MKRIAALLKLSTIVLVAGCVATAKPPEPVDVSLPSVHGKIYRPADFLESLQMRFRQTVRWKDSSGQPRQSSATYLGTVNCQVGEGQAFRAQLEHGSPSRTEEQFVRWAILPLFPVPPIEQGKGPTFGGRQARPKVETSEPTPPAAGLVGDREVGGPQDVELDSRGRIASFAIKEGPGLRKVLCSWDEKTIPGSTLLRRRSDILLTGGGKEERWEANFEYQRHQDLWLPKRLELQKSANDEQPELTIEFSYLDFIPQLRSSPVKAEVLSNAARLLLESGGKIYWSSDFLAGFTCRVDVEGRQGVGNLGPGIQARYLLRATVHPETGWTKFDIEEFALEPASGTPLPTGSVESFDSLPFGSFAQAAQAAKEGWRAFKAAPSLRSFRPYVADSTVEDNFVRIRIADEGLLAEKEPGITQRIVWISRDGVLDRYHYREQEGSSVALSYRWDSLPGKDLLLVHAIQSERRLPNRTGKASLLAGTLRSTWHWEYDQFQGVTLPIRLTVETAEGEGSPEATLVYHFSDYRIVEKQAPGQQAGFASSAQELFALNAGRIYWIWDYQRALRCRIEMRARNPEPGRASLLAGSPLGSNAALRGAFSLSVAFNPAGETVYDFRLLELATDQQAGFASHQAGLASPPGIPLPPESHERALAAVREVERALNPIRGLRAFYQYVETAQQTPEGLLECTIAPSVSLKQQGFTESELRDRTFWLDAEGRFHSYGFTEKDGTRARLFFEWENLPDQGKLLLRTVRMEREPPARGGARGNVVSSATGAVMRIRYQSIGGLLLPETVTIQSEQPGGAPAAEAEYRFHSYELESFDHSDDKLEDQQAGSARRGSGPEAARFASAAGKIYWLSDYVGGLRFTARLHAENPEPDSPLGPEARLNSQAEVGIRYEPNTGSASYEVSQFTALLSGSTGEIPSAVRERVRVGLVRTLEKVFDPISAMRDFYRRIKTVERQGNSTCYVIENDPDMGDKEAGILRRVLWFDQADRLERYEYAQDDGSTTRVLYQWEEMPPLGSLRLRGFRMEKENQPAAFGQLGARYESLWEIEYEDRDRVSLPARVVVRSILPDGSQGARSEYRFSDYRLEGARALQGARAQQGAEAAIPTQHALLFEATARVYHLSDHLRGLSWTTEVTIQNPEREGAVRLLRGTVRSALSFTPEGARFEHKAVSCSAEPPEVPLPPDAMNRLALAARQIENPFELTPGLRVFHRQVRSVDKEGDLWKYTIDISPEDAPALQTLDTRICWVNARGVLVSYLASGPQGSLREFYQWQQVPGQEGALLSSFRMEKQDQALPGRTFRAEYDIFYQTLSGNESGRARVWLPERIRGKLESDGRGPDTLLEFRFSDYSQSQLASPPTSTGGGGAGHIASPSTTPTAGADTLAETGRRIYWMWDRVTRLRASVDLTVKNAEREFGTAGQSLTVAVSCQAKFQMWGDFLPGEGPRFRYERREIRFDPHDFSPPPWLDTRLAATLRHAECLFDTFPPGFRNFHRKVEKVEPVGADNLPWPKLATPRDLAKPACWPERVLRFTFENFQDPARQGPAGVRKRLVWIGPDHELLCYFVEDAGGTTTESYEWEGVAGTDLRRLRTLHMENQRPWIGSLPGAYRARWNVAYTTTDGVSLPSAIDVETWLPDNNPGPGIHVEYRDYEIDLKD